MTQISRIALFGLLTLMLLLAACAPEEGPPTATAQPTSTATINATSTSTPTLSPTSTATLTPVIPVTGPITASTICQFCMDTFTHALLDLPAAATFTVLTPTAPVSAATDVSTGCNAVETFRDRQLVLCRAPSNTSLDLNVCQGSDCLQFTIRLQTCPPPVSNIATPTGIPTLTPTSSTMPTLLPPVSSPTSATSTPTADSSAGSPTPTFIVSPTGTP